MWNRIASIIHKEFLQIRADKRSLAMAIIIPVAWLIVFGYAADFNVHEIPAVVLNQAQGRIGDNLVARLEKEAGFRFVQGLSLRSEADIRQAIQDDRAKVGILIPRNFGKPDQPHSRLKILTDGSDFFTSQAALRKGQAAIQGFLAQVLLERAMARGGAGPLSQGLLGGGVPLAQGLLGTASPLAAGGGNPFAAIVPEVHVLYNPDLRSADVMIPGLTGLVLLFITTLLTGLGVVRERERGTLEQLLVTPIRPYELMIGKIVPYALITMADFALVMVVGTQVFHVPFRGRALGFALSSLSFLLCSLAFGLVVSSIAENQQQAMQLALLIVLPQFILSGFIFPLNAMPWGVRWIAYLLPMTYFLPISRAAFLKGTPLAVQWLPFVILCLFTVVLVALASVLFRKRVA